MSEQSLTVMPGGAVARPQPTAIDILQAAIEKGITSENVAVVKEIRQMVREERADVAKAAFNRAYFDLRQQIATLDFYADKEAKTDTGKVAYTYCSERELASKLDPVLAHHKFAMLFGQREEGDRTVAIITLIHREGHEETREYSVRSGATNRMKDATAADTGATTSAWRHLVIKMFGLKSRIREGDDVRNIGDAITAEQAESLCKRVCATGTVEASFLNFAKAKDYKSIMSGRYDELDEFLSKRERLQKAKADADLQKRINEGKP